MIEFSDDSKKQQENQHLAEWYSCSGPENDVVLSTRVRLARNLASFPFPNRFKDDDESRVQLIVFDSFSHCKNPDNYQGIATSNLEELGEKILEERGILEKKAGSSKKNDDSKKSNEISGSGVIIRTDGKVSCTVNDIDHVRLSAFVPGLDGESAFRMCHELDEELQNTMQFAASYDVGFLTSAIKDCGSGMKISCRVHLPSLSFSGKLRSFTDYLSERRLVVSDCFGSGSMPFSSLGFYYQISTSVAENGNEIDQIASLVSAVKYLADNERRETSAVMKVRQTELKDRIYKTFATVKSSLLIGLREGVEIISDVKWGKNLGFLSGISDEALCALLYRIQNGYIHTSLRYKKFSFPADIAENEELKANSLRALILQEAFENLKVN